MNALLESLRSDRQHTCRVENPPSVFAVTPNRGQSENSAHTNWLRHRAITHGDWTTPSVCSSGCNGLDTNPTHANVPLSTKQQLLILRALRLYQEAMPYFKPLPDVVEREMDALLRMFDIK